MTNYTEMAQDYLSGYNVTVSLENVEFWSEVRRLSGYKEPEPTLEDFQLLSEKVAFLQKHGFM